MTVIRANKLSSAILQGITFRQKRRQAEREKDMTTSLSRMKDNGTQTVTYGGDHVNDDDYQCSPHF